ncbi:Ribonuclease VapC32 [Crenothrix polyspora]|uniref:Ribonuclease VapC32 n=1 Tax=Crenothrix polyspora TaxID=360316 RepID=A0A1R4H5X3_9GAMM|nr:type II toxin-antitoxin system VapC family toxin [Crenothrix polyspora]SJM91431.1 Ribonuclease VapC32 [Crenothrix polyspora]
MILVDTSLWIDHLRGVDSPLLNLLASDLICIHPWIIGELACGNLKNRQEILSLLNDLPSCPAANEAEVLYFIDQHQLMGRGIGYIDVHLLAASIINDAQIWTRDKRLLAIADTLGIAYVPKNH